MGYGDVSGVAGDDHHLHPFRQLGPRREVGGSGRLKVAFDDLPKKKEVDWDEKGFTAADGPPLAALLPRCTACMALELGANPSLGGAGVAGVCAAAMGMGGR
eukprot:gene34677-50528_t